MAEFRYETVDLSADDIADAAMDALAFARNNFGEHVDARSIDLRLWAAAALINSAIRASQKDRILASLEQKLAIMEGEPSKMPPGGVYPK